MVSKELKNIDEIPIFRKIDHVGYKLYFKNQLIWGSRLREIYN